MIDFFSFNFSTLKISVFPMKDQQSIVLLLLSMFFFLDCLKIFSLYLIFSSVTDLPGYDILLSEGITEFLESVNLYFILFINILGIIFLIPTPCSSFVLYLLGLQLYVCNNGDIIQQITEALLSVFNLFFLCTSDSIIFINLSSI